MHIKFSFDAIVLEFRSLQLNKALLCYPSARLGDNQLYFYPCTRRWSSGQLFDRSWPEDQTVQVEQANVETFCSVSISLRISSLPSTTRISTVRLVQTHFLFLSRLLQAPCSDFFFARYVHTPFTTFALWPSQNHVSNCIDQHVSFFNLNPLMSEYITIFENSTYNCT